MILNNEYSSLCSYLDITVDLNINFHFTNEYGSHKSISFLYICFMDTFNLNFKKIPIRDKLIFILAHHEITNLTITIYKKPNKFLSHSIYFILKIYVLLFNIIFFNK